MRSTSGTGIVERRAEHEAGRHLLRHLVDRARAVDVRGCPTPATARGCRATGPRLCAFGLPRYAATASLPCAARISPSRRSISANASAQVTSRHVVALADHRDAHAVGIGLELLDRGALRAQVAVTEHVVAVAAHEARSRRLPCAARARTSLRTGDRSDTRCVFMLVRLLLRSCWLRKPTVREPARQVERGAVVARDRDRPTRRRCGRTARPADRSPSR